MKEKLEVKVSSLVEVLKRLEDIAKKDLYGDIPVVAFHDGKIIARSTSCFAVCKFKHPLKEVLLPFVPLMTLLQSFSEKRKVIIKQSKSKINFSMKKTSSSLAMLKWDDTRNPNLCKPRWSKESIPLNFVESIKKCMTILPKDALRYDLTLLSITGTHITSCDDARIIRCRLDSSFGNSFYLSRNQADAILANNFTSYCFAKDTPTLQLQSSDKKQWADFVLPQEINYPNITDEMLSYDPNNTVKIPVESTLGLLNRVVIFSEGKTDVSKICDLELKGKKVVFNASNSIGSCVEETKNISEYEGKLKTFINPVYFSELLKSCPDRF